jgi:hypothetical protein
VSPGFRFAKVSFAEPQLSLDEAIDRVSIIDCGSMPRRVSNLIRKCAPLCWSVPRCVMLMFWHAASSPLHGTGLSAAAVRIIATAARTPIAATGGRYTDSWQRSTKDLAGYKKGGRAQLAMIVAPALDRPAAEA